MEQLTLGLDMSERVPGQCASERESVGTGKSRKSFCGEMACWTNCMEFGQCTWESWQREREARRAGARPDTARSGS